MAKFPPYFTLKGVFTENRSLVYVALRFYQWYIFLQIQISHSLSLSVPTSHVSDSMGVLSLMVKPAVEVFRINELALKTVLNNCVLFLL